MIHTPILEQHKEINTYIWANKHGEKDNCIMDLSKNELY
jgi:hypothetical protein